MSASSTTCPMCGVAVVETDVDCPNCEEAFRKVDQSVAKTDSPLRSLIWTQMILTILAAVATLEEYGLLHFPRSLAGRGFLANYPFPIVAITMLVQAMRSANPTRHRVSAFVATIIIGMGMFFVSVACQ